MSFARTSSESGTRRWLRKIWRNCLRDSLAGLLKSQPTEDASLYLHMSFQNMFRAFLFVCAAAAAAAHHAGVECLEH